MLSDKPVKRRKQGSKQLRIPFQLRQRGTSRFQRGQLIWFVRLANPVPGCRHVLQRQPGQLMQQRVEVKHLAALAPACVQHDQAELAWFTQARGHHDRWSRQAQRLVLRRIRVEQDRVLWRVGGHLRKKRRADQVLQGLFGKHFAARPYDGHILSAVLEQATNLTQDIAVKLKHIVVDLGFRGVDADNPDQEIIHRGKFTRLSKQQKGWLKRRSALEPAIGHLKSDHRMDRCWLKGALGDALHAISCAAGYNLRWLLRAIARLGIGAVFLRLLQAALSALQVTRRPYRPHQRSV